METEELTITDPELQEAFNNYKFNIVSAVIVAELREDEVMMRRIKAIAESVTAIVHCAMGGKQHD